MSKPRKQKAAGSVKPHECVIAAIDSDGDMSGFAKLASGKLVFSREVKSAMVRHTECVLAYNYALDRKMPIVFVIEDTGGAFKTWASAVGYGDSRGKWIQVIEELTGRDDHIVYIPQVTWRSRIGMKRQPDRTAYKREAVRLVRMMFGVVCGDDEAEAILLGHVASRSPEVGAMLGKISRARKKAA